MTPHIQKTLSIPPWVPENARQKLTELWNQYPDQEDRQRLHRLATYEAMETEVWKKLHRLPGPSHAHASVVEDAFLLSSSWLLSVVARPPPPKKATDLTRYLLENPSPSEPSDAVVHAASLLKVMNAFAGDARAAWPSHWEGEMTISFDDARNLVFRIAEFYIALNEQHNEIIRRLPKVKYRGAKYAKQNFFTQAISYRLLALYGKPLDSVVRTITDVAFDIRDTGSTDSLRKRRKRVRRMR